MGNMGRRPIYVMLLVGVLAAAMGIMALQAMPLTMALSQNTVTANVNVGGICWTAALPNPQTFGSVSPGTSTATNLQVTDNDIGGNMAAYLWLMGGPTNSGNWQWGTNTINVGNTVYNAVSQGSYLGNALTSTTANTNIFLAAPTIAAPTNSVNIFFGLNVPGGTANGPYQQVLTFNNLCSQTSSNTLTLTANVIGTCYTSVTPSSISFGNMYPGTTYNTNVVVTDNDVNGNVGAAMYVQGNANWVFGSNNIGVSNTVYNAVSQSAYLGNALSNTFVNTNIAITAPTQATPYASANIYFGMSVPGGTTAGLYTENIIIENSC